MLRMSPLRYPGGKGKMYDIVKNIIIDNNLKNCTYVEPFAGGAEIALRLLAENIVDKIIINDFDKSIYSFWYSILYYTDEFIKKITEIAITLEERENQIKIYNNPLSSVLELGFATFYLNRVNRSGIIKGGPISKSLNTKYPLDCRFKKENLIKRIMKISEMKNRIIICNEDASLFLKRSFTSPTFLFIDPPYYFKAKSLYMNYYSHEDHLNLKNIISSLNDKIFYIITYDNVPQIKQMYSEFNFQEYELTYTVSVKKKGNEIMFYSKNLIIPSPL